MSSPAEISPLVVGRSRNGKNGVVSKMVSNGKDANLPKTENLPKVAKKINEMRQEHEKMQRQPVMNLLKVLNGDQTVKNILTMENFEKLSPQCRKTLLKLLPRCDRIGPRGTKFKPSPSALNNEYFKQACVEYKDKLLSGYIFPNGQPVEKYNCYSYEKLDPWKKRHFEAYFGEKLHEPTSSSEEETAPAAVEKANKKVALVSSKKIDKSTGKRHPTNQSCVEASHAGVSTMENSAKRNFGAIRKSSRSMRPFLRPTNQKSPSELSGTAPKRLDFFNSDQPSAWNSVGQGTLSLLDPRPDTDSASNSIGSNARLLRMKISVKNKTCYFGNDQSFNNMVKSWLESDVVQGCSNKKTKNVEQIEVCGSDPIGAQQEGAAPPNAEG